MALINFAKSGTYAVADNLSYDKGRSIVGFNVTVYKDSNKEEDEVYLNQYFNVKDESSFNTYFALSVINGSDTNIIKQAYLYLKSLPIFSEVADG